MTAARTKGKAMRKRVTGLLSTLILVAAGSGLGSATSRDDVEQSCELGELRVKS